MTIIWWRMEYRNIQEELYKIMINGFCVCRSIHMIGLNLVQWGSTNLGEQFNSMIHFFICMACHNETHGFFSFSLSILSVWFHLGQCLLIQRNYCINHQLVTLDLWFYSVAIHEHYHNQNNRRFPSILINNILC